MSDSPLLSVLMPVYNAAPYIEKAVDSILSQDFRDFEFVIVNDGSTDDSLQILERYRGLDRRIVLINRPNAGMVAALNHGASASRGQYIARMDADDVSTPGRLQSQIAYLTNAQDVVCLSGNFEYMDSKGRPLTVIRLPDNPREIERLALAGHPPLCHGCAMMRRDALMAIGGYDASLWPAEDVDLYLRLMEIGRLANLQQVLLRVRLHGKSIGARTREIQATRARQAAINALARRGIASASLDNFPPWRPGKDRDSQFGFALRCGWWAFNSGYRRTALIYALKALVKRPFGADGWILLICTFTKRKQLSQKQASI
jgi:hypothetical protein